MHFNDIASASIVITMVLWTHIMVMQYHGMQHNYSCTFSPDVILQMLLQSRSFPICTCIKAPVTRTGPGPVDGLAQTFLMKYSITTLFLPLSFLASVSGALCKRYGCRTVMVLGGAVAMISTFLASFSTKLWHIYICFGMAGM